MFNQLYSGLMNAGQQQQDPNPVAANPLPWQRPSPFPVFPTPPQQQEPSTGRQGSKKHVYKPEDLMQFEDSGGLKTSGGQIPGYPIEKVKGIIRGAKAMGVDPYQALALAMQETGIGMDKHATPHSLLGTSYEVSDKGRKSIQEASLKNPDLNDQFLYLAQTLREKSYWAKHDLKSFVDPNNEAQVLQAYNGYGTNVKREAFGKGVTKAYGVTIPDEGLNMKKNNYYGKRLVQLKNDMMKQKAWKSLVDSIN